MYILLLPGPGHGLEGEHLHHKDQLGCKPLRNGRPRGLAGIVLRGCTLHYAMGLADAGNFRGSVALTFITSALVGSLQVHAELGSHARGAP